MKPMAPLRHFLRVALFLFVVALNLLRCYTLDLGHVRYLDIRSVESADDFHPNSGKELAKRCRTLRGSSPFDKLFKQVKEKHPEADIIRNYTIEVKPKFLGTCRKIFGEPTAVQVSNK